MSARIPAGYPGKPFLTEAEAARVLHSGPELEWFDGFAEHVIDMTGKNQGAYGYVHVYMRGGAFRVDSASWPTKEGLAHGLDDLWQDHGGHGLRTDPTYPRCEECTGVMYFTADEPLRLRGEVEPDGVGEENPEWTVVTRPVGMPDAGDEAVES